MWLAMRGVRVTMVEQWRIAGAASGKAGGFLRRDTKPGPTRMLHKKGLMLHRELASKLKLKSFRETHILKVWTQDPMRMKPTPKTCPWLDGHVSYYEETRESLLGQGCATAQVTPSECVDKMWKHAQAHGAELLIGNVNEVIRDEDGKVSRVKVSIRKGRSVDGSYSADNGGGSIRREVADTEKKGIQDENEDSEQPTQVELKADAFVFAMGPWTVMCERWFPDIDIPMVGIKNSSVVLRSSSFSSSSSSPSSSSASSLSSLVSLPTSPAYSHRRNKPDAKEEGKREGGGAAANTMPPVVVVVAEKEKNGCVPRVIPRPNGDIYICGCGGNTILRSHELVNGRNGPENMLPQQERVQAVMESFASMSSTMSRRQPDVAQACMRPCTSDGLPIMGRIPGSQNAFISTGHNCWGILWGPISGLAMAELILEGRCTFLRNISAFSPERFSWTKKKLPTMYDYVGGSLAESNK